MNKLFIFFFIVGFFISCKSNQSEQKINTIAEIVHDTLLSKATVVTTISQEKNDVIINQFNQLRLAIASQNPKQIMPFFDFPLTDDQANGLEDALNFTSSNKITGDITLEKDFEKNTSNLFDKNVIKSLGEISLEILLQNKISTSKIFHIANEKTDYSVSVSIDDVDKEIQISVNATYPPSNDNEDTLESASIYFFKINQNNQLKFIKVLSAG